MRFKLYLGGSLLRDKSLGLRINPNSCRISNFFACSGMRMVLLNFVVMFLYLLSGLFDCVKMSLSSGVERLTP